MTRIKVLSRLRTDEHLSLRMGNAHGNRRELSTFASQLIRIANGEKTVLRLLSTQIDRSLSLTSG
jgi:hypothetical protein